MFCRKCGKEINDTALFCPHCGNASENAQPKQAVAPVVPVAPVAPQPAPVAKKEEKDNWMALIGLICSGLGALQIIPFIGNVVGLILSIVGVKKSKELEGKGKTLGVIGIVISSITLGLWLLGTIGTVILGLITGFGPILSLLIQLLPFLTLIFGESEAMLGNAAAMLMFL